MKTMEQKLDEVLVGAVPAAPGFVEEVMGAVREEGGAGARAGAWGVGRRWVVSTGAVGALAACVMLAVMLWPAPAGRQLYAAVVAALAEVKSVHVTGWTARVERRHVAAEDAAAAGGEAGGRHAVEEWEWRGDDGVVRRWRRQGAVTAWEDGERRYEYQADRGRVYVDEAQGGRQAKQFAGMLGQLESLTEKGWKVMELGERREEGRVMRGVLAERAGERRVEAWFDVGRRLPVRLAMWLWQGGKWVQMREAVVAYDVPVAEAVAGYAVPAGVERVYSWAVDERFEAWRERLKALAARYRDGSRRPERMELVERGEGEKGYAAWTYGQLPGVETHVVRPLGPTTWGPLTVRDLVRETWRPVGTVRVPAELGEVTLNYDLVLEKGVGLRDQLEFVLAKLGMEVVVGKETRRVWVARHDGREMKDWSAVKAPVANAKNVPLRPGMAMTTGAVGMGELLGQVVFYQDEALTARGVLIEDRTGLGDRPVSSESPYFAGKKGLELAREWFREELGVRFEEEEREVEVGVLRRKGE